VGGTSGIYVYILYIYIYIYIYMSDIPPTYMVELFWFQMYNHFKQKHGLGLIWM
jgi:hypothetical protein